MGHSMRMGKGLYEASMLKRNPHTKNDKYQFKTGEFLHGKLQEMKD